ncbi:hypothetical protein KKC59_01705, partial [bacterium]|nr:hypothetical protein [bacterium]
KIFLKQIKAILTDIEIKKHGRKVLDLNYVNFLINVLNDLNRDSFFQIAPVIFNKLIMTQLKSFLGDVILTAIEDRLREMIGRDYPFMEEVELIAGKIDMDVARRASKEVEVKILVNAFRDYTYAFLYMITALTSDILIERL